MARPSLPVLRYFCAILLVVATTRTSAAAPITKVHVDRDGVCRVTDRGLTDAGRPFSDTEIERIALHLRGEEIPLLVTKRPSGSPDGRFELEFIGSIPHGEKTYLNEYTSTSSIFTVHHELNKRLIRFSGSQIHDESWFRGVVRVTDGAATSVVIPADDVAKEGDFTARSGAVPGPDLLALPQPDGELRRERVEPRKTAVSTVSTTSYLSLPKKSAGHT